MALTTLRIGSAGPLVDLAQYTLDQLGFGPLAITGEYDAGTAQAVKRFQSAMVLPASGEVDTQVWYALSPTLLGFTYHTVQPGETLYEIARHQGSSLPLLRSANPKVNPANMPVGAQIVVPFDRSVVSTGIRYSYDILRMNLNALRIRYPFLQQTEAGYSALGRPLYVLRVGNGRKQVFYNASHHANEWLTTPVLMQYIERFCRAYIDGAQIAGYSAGAIFGENTLHILPMVNPDGVDLVTGAFAKDSAPYQSALALSMEGIPFPAGWKANIRGVDLNVNYPAGWEQAREIKYALGYTRPGPRDYVGPYPLSEPETQAVAAYTQRSDFRLTLSYHSQGEVIYWKYLDYQPASSYEIARAFANASGYAVEQTPAASAYAGYKDWFIQQYDLPGYTIEVGRGTNPLPLDQFPRIYADNEGILTLGAVLAPPAAP